MWGIGIRVSVDVCQGGRKVFFVGFWWLLQHWSQDKERLLAISLHPAAYLAWVILQGLL